MTLSAGHAASKVHRCYLLKEITEHRYRVFDDITSMWQTVINQRRHGFELTSWQIQRETSWKTFLLLFLYKCGLAQGSATHFK